MRDQRKLIHRWDWDFLIILDACRADVFEDVCGIRGYYERVRSPAPCTVLWLERTFTGFYDVVYVSANPFVNSKGRLPHVRFDATKHFAEIVDVWDFGWDEANGTVPPKHVNYAVKRLISNGSAKKMIIHYIQPHFPYIGDRKFLEIDAKWSMDEFRYAVPKPNERIRWAIKAGIVTVEDLKNAYRNNLRLVLRYVRKLLDHLEGKVVITSDHGELLGEDGLFLHECHYNHPILRTVPWLEIKL